MAQPIIVSIDVLAAAYVDEKSPDAFDGMPICVFRRSHAYDIAVGLAAKGHPIAIIGGPSVALTDWLASRCGLKRAGIHVVETTPSQLALFQRAIVIGGADLPRDSAGTKMRFAATPGGQALQVLQLPTKNYVCLGSADPGQTPAADRGTRRFRAGVTRLETMLGTSLTAPIPAPSPERDAEPDIAVGR